MNDVDIILISQSELVNYDQYSQLPLDRVDLYRDIVFPRMVYYQGAFRSHVDLINLLRSGLSFRDVPFAERRRLLSVWNLPSFGGMHLANYLLGHGIRTCVINNLDSEFDRFLEIYFACKQPPLVGISSTFHLSFSEIRRLIRELRKHAPCMRIAVGGAFVNALTQTGPPSQFESPMRRFGIDYILYGFNSESDLRDMVIRTRQGTNIDDVPKLAYISHGAGGETFRITESRWNPPALNDIPALWESLDLPFLKHTVQMRTSSGCPFACAFCSYPKVARGFRVMRLDVLELHLRSLLQLPGINQVVFLDDTLNFPPKRFREMCRMFCDYDFEWYCFLRVQFIDEETSRLMSDSGCRGVYLGIESANDVVLGNMNKRSTRKDFEQGLANLKKNDISCVAAFILGFPGETDRTIRDNVEFIENSGVDYYTLKEFYYMEHTAIHRDRARFGLSGMGNKWAHSTMDSMEAYRYKVQMFETIQNSTFIDPDTSLWHIILLRDCGFSFREIDSIQREINWVVKDQINGTFDDHHPALVRLQGFFSE